jgi:hypothetical protein
MLYTLTVIRWLETNAWALAASASFAVVTLVGSPVRASERAPFFLTYTAPPGCPDRQAWLEELSLRSPRVVLAAESERAPILRVDLAEIDGRVRADLVAIDVDGRETPRTVFASSCREAAVGSAWIAAVWLDPSLLPPAQPTTLAPEATVAPVPNAAMVETRKGPAGRPPPPGSADSARATPVRVEANVQVGSFMSALPGVPVGFGVFLGVSAWPATVFAPLLRWGYVAAGKGTADTERGDVQVSLGMARGLGCVFAWRASIVALRPCAFFELGHLDGAGENTTLPTTEAAAWRSLGTLARAEFRISSMVSLDAEAGLVFPLARDRFVFGPPPPVVGFAVPPVAGSFSLGLSLGTSVGGPTSGGN